MRMFAEIMQRHIMKKDVPERMRDEGVTMMNLKINLKGDEKLTFWNNVDFCVGTGRMGLALTEEYLKELSFVQDIIGFKHIRGHGLFTDDVAIYQKRKNWFTGEITIEYNFTYLDRIFDAFLERKIVPFLELGFMPKEMASGEQTIFYWKGNTTPPKDYKDWTELVTVTLSHLVKRYGEQVYEWPIEVWNEPNLPGFWKDANMEEYFRLFKETFLAIKKLDSRFRIGGPAICGVRDKEWMSAFFDFCKKEGIKPDFATRHHYTTEMPKHAGHYGYQQLSDPELGFENLQGSRDIIDSYEEFKGMEMHLTEFNTSYIPNNPLHDTNENAAYLAYQLLRLGETSYSYSYWTFGDVFEEQGVPFSLFHGGFGLVAHGCIPKPTFWTFAFYKRLKERTEDCVYKGRNGVIVKNRNNGYEGIFWNLSDEEDVCFEVKLPAAEAEYTVIRETVDEMTCNPQKAWHDLGEPKNPTKEETELIRRFAYPFCESEILKKNRGKMTLTGEVRPHGVVYVSINPRTFEGDTGFTYGRRE